MIAPTFNKKLDPILLLRTACFALFIGRAWQHLVWDAPFRSLFWDEEWFSSWVETLTPFTWNDYVTSAKADGIIQGIIRGFGWFYLCMAFVVLGINSQTKKLRWLLWLSSLSLMFLAFLYCKEKFFHVGQFFEYTIQFMCPIFLYSVIFQKERTQLLSLEMKLAIALTFTCHGLYVFGYYPRPGNFVDMTLNILPISENATHVFLKLMGIIDFMIALGIFFPVVDKPLLIWAVIWGTLTALARIVANFYVDFWFETLNQWLPHVLYRLSHGLVPLTLLVMSYQHYFSKTGILKKKVEIA